ncbi:MAG: nitroreductase family protein [Actinomycetota bacterium]
MEFQEAVRRRRMVRNYSTGPVDPARLERIMACACRGPSAGFSQGQSFVVVQDGSTRMQIARIAGESAYVEKGYGPWLTSAPVHVVCCTSEAEYRQRYQEPGKLAAHGGEREWPVPFWFVDAGGALLLLLLAVVDEGLAAGFLAFDRNKTIALGQLLGIPSDIAVVGVVTIGTPAPDRRSGSLSRGRKPADLQVRHERWAPDRLS